MWVCLHLALYLFPGSFFFEIESIKTGAFQITRRTLPVSQRDESDGIAVDLLLNANEAANGYIIALRLFEVSAARQKKCVTLRSGY